MSMDLTGIGNRNEYYTNHYFSTMFEDGASERIKQWTEESKNQDIKTPWAMLRDNAKQYYPIHDRYDRGQSQLTTAANIITMAALYLESMGYGKANSVIINVNDEFDIPVFHEETKANKAPALWAVLAHSKDKNCGIMENNVLDFNAVNNDDLRLSNENIEALATKLLFHTAEPPRFLIVIGIDTIVLIDRNKWNEKRYLEFDLQEIFSRHETSTLQAMSVLLHKDSLCPADGSALIDTLDEQSRKHASGVSQDLKYALRESIEILGNEIIYDMSTRQGKNLIAEPVDAEKLTIECLRYMYRMLFVLFIEARPELGYAPINEQVYASGYSLESLRDIAESVRNDTEEVGEGFYLFETISKLYELIYTGYPKNEAIYNKVNSLQSVHNIFVIPPLKAHIFDPAYTPMLVNAKIRNCVMLRIIDLMSLTKSTGKTGSRRGRISYANLGINQMGAVYEALLSYRGFIAEQDLYEVKKAGDNFNELDVGYFVTAQELDQYTEEERVRYESGDKKGQLRVHPKGEFIYRLAGREREKSASYYTPESLTQCLVKYALKELLKDKTADEILSLTVCEPAMGSAAFLNEAINQLAEAYIDRKQAERGETISHESRMDELQKVKMYIADNNVYGIDLNPVAVELAEVSLWLNTIYRGGYVPWFGTQLVNGNSLIGARRQVYHKNQLTTTSKGLRWYENAPERIPFVKLDTSGRNIARSRYQVYHFLTGDPGMCDYTDKVIKSLESEKLKVMKDWNKRFTAPYTEDEFKNLIGLSKLIDVLWREQIKARRDLEAATVTVREIYGHKDTRFDRGQSIREKDKLLRNIYKSEHAKNAGAYARLKFAMDYWCALWFWPISEANLLPERSEFISDMYLILQGMMPTNSQEKQTSLFDINIEDDVMIQNVNLDQLCEMFPRLGLVRKIANGNKFMHWELEFTDVFADKGGFDLVIGNPPWEKITWNEQGLLSDYNPMYGIKGWKAPEVAKQRTAELAVDKIKIAYIEEYVSLTGIQNFMAAAQNYILLKGQQTNLYKGFLPQAWDFGRPDSVSAFIHQDSVFDDPSGGVLRKVLYPKLRKHFKFNNKFLLFPISTSREFSLNVYSNEETDTFDCINNLFATSTIEDCYNPDCNHKLYGLKDDSNNWCVTGHPDRIITVGENELLLFARLFDNSDDWRQARLPVLHAKPIINVLECFANQENKIENHLDKISSTVFWDETNAPNNGIIVRNVHFAENLTDLILSGAHLGVGNPLFKASRRNCSSRYDFDPIDLTIISDDYLQRCNYSPATDLSDYSSKVPLHSDGEKITSFYRFAARKMLNLPGDRTFMGAIIPPQSAHINGIISLTFSDYKQLVSFAGGAASVPYDFMIKLLGKQNLYGETLGLLPIISFNDDLIARSLMLNSLNKSYAELWKTLWKDEFTSLKWSKSDIRLRDNAFSILTEEWSHDSALRTDYERRWAMIELDVLVALLMGLSLSDLIAIYRIYFPVLKQNEEDTWYDVNGRIVFTTNATLTGIGFDRKEWEGNVKGAPAGKVFTREIEDDTMPGGPVKRTIEYVAPFDKCDREQDYETAWKFFEKKYGK